MCVMCSSSRSIPPPPLTTLSTPLHNREPYDTFPPYALPPTPPRPAPPRERICDGYGLQLETACFPGDHINERSCAIRDVVAGDLPGASTETRGLFAHVLPQAVLDRPREGMVPGITAPTRAGQPAPAAGAPPPPRRNVMNS